MKQRFTCSKFKPDGSSFNGLLSQYYCNRSKGTESGAG